MVGWPGRKISQVTGFPVTSNEILLKTAILAFNLYRPGTQVFTSGSKTGWFMFGQGMNSPSSKRQRMKPSHLFGSGTKSSKTPLHKSSMLGGLVWKNVDVSGGIVWTGGVGTGTPTSLSQVSLFPGTQPSLRTKILPSPQSFSRPPMNCYETRCNKLLETLKIEKLTWHWIHR